MLLPAGIEFNHAPAPAALLAQVRAGAGHHSEGYIFGKAHGSGLGLFTVPFWAEVRQSRPRLIELLRLELVVQ